MTRARSNILSLIAAAVMGLAALLPVSAQANSCPAVGTSVFYGSCAPRAYCDRYDVIRHSRKDGSWGFNARVYRRNFQGWTYVTNAWTICY